MPTLDDADLTQQDDTEPVFGQPVHDMLTAAADSKRVRTQVIGRRAQRALDELATVLKREQKIAEAEQHLARIRRGEE